jgi:glycosyltransferase involved in cell wall biosynthesis
MISESFHKTKLLIISPEFAPGYDWGGPIISLLHLCEKLSVKCEITVFTSNRKSPNTTEVFSNEELQQSFKGVKFIYRFKSTKPNFVPLAGIYDLFGLINKNDTIYINSTYNLLVLVAFIITKITNKKCIWAPRGALQARVLFKDNSYKKRIFELLINKFMDIKKSEIWFSSELEKENLPTRFCKYNSIVEPNIEFNLKNYKARQPKTLVKYLFFSRIDEIKGIFDFLECGKLDSLITITICGPILEQDKIRLHKAIKKYPNINYKTPVYNVDEKLFLFYSHDALILPTKHENFGNVIVEAINSGLPIFTTINTPFKDIGSRGIGCCCLNEVYLANFIKNITVKDIYEMSKRIPKYIVST